MARIVEANSEMVREGAEILRAGGVVVFPTETVYGLGADTFNASAVGKIYAVKRRPANNPLIAHVIDVAQAKQVSGNWDSRCDELAGRFWPGPLTLVTAKAEGVPLRATAGLATVAVRSPKHEVARELLRAFGGPISAPSANRSGRVSPTRAEHAASEFEDAEDLMILDGGASDVGIESTVLDVSRRKARVLRLGSVTVEQIEEVVGEVDRWMVSEQGESPGTGFVHYSPRTKAELVASAAIRARLEELKEEQAAVLVLKSNVKEGGNVRVIRMPMEADGYAAHLYDSMREADEMGVARILIEQPAETTGVWEAIQDRLKRATNAQSVD